MTGANGHDAQAEANARHTIVVMDANDSVHRLIQLLLQLNGYRVLPAESGDHVLRLLREGANVSVVVLDLMSDGATAVMHEANALYPDLRLVVMSAPAGEVAPPDRRILRLRKPFTPSDLLQAVGEAIRAR